MSTESTTRAETVIYRIDRNDVLVGSGGRWRAFAEANGGIGSDPFGRPLWDSVAGDDVQAIWRLLLQRVRRTGDLAVFVYRCDAPRVRRLLQMELVPDEDGAIEFRSSPIREDERDPIAFVDRTAPRGDEHLTVCGWCARVQIGDWVEPEWAVGRLGLLGGDPQPQLTHGICGTCAADMRALALSG